MKIAIGDAGDASFDSGVFLEKRMFVSQPPDPLMTFIECETEENVIALVDSVLLYNVDNSFKDNITFTGDPRAVGYFMGGELLGFENNTGIVLTTGKTDELNSVNSCDGNLSLLNQGGSDDDLAQLSGKTILEACVIEFDIKNTGDSIDFNTVFASEDYHDRVNSELVDVYGLFVSGPGISGPFLNDAVNTGLIPGTSLPVMVNNLNCGNVEQGCDPELSGDNYCELLVDNLNTQNEGFFSLPFDAYTVPLPAGSSLGQNEWYHVKIAIGDCEQFTFDSGIFLEAGVNTFDSLYVSVEKPSFSDQIKLVPNPAKEYMRVDILDNINIEQISIFDMNGKKLKSIDPNDAGINLAGLPKGMLIVEITAENQTIRKKLIHE